MTHSYFKHNTIIITKIIKIYNSSLYTVCSLRIEMVKARYEKERNVVPIGASNKFNFKHCILQERTASKCFIHQTL